jgi:hypothetical protein
VVKPTNFKFIESSNNKDNNTSIGNKDGFDPLAFYEEQNKDLSAKTFGDDLVMDSVVNTDNLGNNTSIISDPVLDTPRFDKARNKEIQNAFLSVTNPGVIDKSKSNDYPGTTPISEEEKNKKIKEISEQWKKLSRPVEHKDFSEEWNKSVRKSFGVKENEDATGTRNIEAKRVRNEIPNAIKEFNRQRTEEFKSKKMQDSTRETLKDFLVYKKSIGNMVKASVQEHLDQNDKTLNQGHEELLESLGLVTDSFKETVEALIKKAKDDNFGLQPITIEKLKEAKQKQHVIQRQVKQ